MLRSPETAPPSPPAHPGRIEVVDWLRGVAVALMILAHGFDAWLLPAAKTGFPYEVIKLLSGIPARLFLFLVGVSAAIQFETALKKNKAMPTLRSTMLRRGLLIILLAYLFRLQEWLLSGFYGGWQSLVRVDILNAIGLSLVMVALVATPRQGRRQILACLAVAAILLGFGPIIGPAHFPAWLPAPLTSYLGGQRPMSWFPFFPWGAWAMVGVAVGHWWVTGNRREQGLRRVLLLGGAVGLGLVASVHLIRAIAPTIISYPSKVVFQMGPGVFLHRLGLIGMLALLGFFWCRALRGRFSVMRQLGRTSLLIYWIHIDLCYGNLAYRVKDRLSVATAAALILALIGLMLAVSLARTHALPLAINWLRQRCISCSSPRA
jgi:uncharacterized membrane protein